MTVWKHIRSGRKFKELYRLKLTGGSDLHVYEGANLSVIVPAGRSDNYAAMPMADAVNRDAVIRETGKYEGAVHATNGDKLVVYQDMRELVVWFRLESEFEDGRFERPYEPPHLSRVEFFGTDRSGLKQLVRVTDANGLARLTHVDMRHVKTEDTATFYGKLAQLAIAATNDIKDGD